MYSAWHTISVCWRGWLMEICGEGSVCLFQSFCVSLTRIQAVYSSVVLFFRPLDLKWNKQQLWNSIYEHVRNKLWLSSTIWSAILKGQGEGYYDWCSHWTHRAVVRSSSQNNTGMMKSDTGIKNVGRLLGRLTMDVHYQWCFLSRYEETPAIFLCPLIFIKIFFLMYFVSSSALSLCSTC